VVCVLFFVFWDGVMVVAVGWFFVLGGWGLFVGVLWG